MFYNKIGIVMNVILQPVQAEIEEKRSRFIAELANVRSEDEARAFLDTVRTKHRDARHHCFAYRLGLGDTVLERFSDDGEPQGTAGKPILELLRGQDLRDAICVVTRYFGGTLLGTGGLVRAYGGACREAIAKAELKELFEGVSFYVDIPYDMLNKLKYTAAKLGIYISSEEYGEKCRLGFAMEEDKLEAFSGAVNSLSLGKAAPADIKRAYCHDHEKPVVYKML